MAKKQVIQAKLFSLSPQRQQYKPYAYELTFDGVELEIELPPDSFVTQTGNKTVLNMKGFQALLATLADAVEEVHEEYVIKARKAGKY